MQLSRLVLTSATLVLGTTLACGEGRSPFTPSPSSTGPGGAGPDGATLKIPAPTPQSPANGTQVFGNPTLVFTNVSGTYASFPVTYEIDLRNEQNATVAVPTVPASEGATTSVTVTQQLQFDATHTWRVRATYDGAYGPWSAARTFRTMAAGYIAGNEIFDPLTTGRTVGTIVGPVDFVPGGLELLSQESYIEYRLDPTLEAGEMSIMITGVDEGSPGDKSKVMSMREDNDGFITDNDYRVTIEKRGRDYVTPGATTFRVISGDAADDDRIHDGRRLAVEYSDENWYFFKFVWDATSARLTVREGGETGPVIYDEGVGLAHVYRPTPHYVYIGSPPLRNGSIDQSIPGMIARDFWVSGKPRRQFPLFSSPTGR